MICILVVSVVVFVFWYFNGNVFAIHVQRNYTKVDKGEVLQCSLIILTGTTTYESGSKYLQIFRYFNKLFIIRSKAHEAFEVHTPFLFRSILTEVCRF